MNTSLFSHRYGHPGPGTPAMSARSAPKIRVVHIVGKLVLALIALLQPTMTRAATAPAEVYPDKPIRLIVGYTPGGATDILARTIGQKLTLSMGQQVIVDNRAGGGGAIAAVIEAKAPPDGYTLMLGTISTLATNVPMYSSLPYDPVKDFTPVALVAFNPYLLMIHPSVPANTVKEFIALGKTQPGRLNYGSSGAGGGAHLSAEMFRSMAGINIVHVPYKGAAQALSDLVGGQIQLSFVAPVIALPQYKAGKLKALGVTSAKRLSSLPNMPTIVEGGVPGYEATAWQGVVSTAGTPKPIVNKLHAEITKALNLPDVRERLAATGSEPGDLTPERFGAFIRNEIVKWSKVVKESGAKVN